MLSRILEPGPYRLTRFVLLRFLGLVYLAAFLSAAFQLVHLVGESGLTPVGPILEQAADRAGGEWSAFWRAPTLFFFDHTDAALTVIPWVGVVGSLVVLSGYANGLLMVLLWALYLSIHQAGQGWYSFGWEIQLSETGFLAIFLCPFLDGRPFRSRPPPKVVIWLFWWLAFRIMLGAGLIKIRGDECWRDLTCLVNHYETQPIPHPLSWLIHQAPVWFHKGGVLFNHLVELIAPLLLFGPRLGRHVAASLMLIFQVLLIFSGNLAFLNWLTIVPILACLDDTIWARVVPKRWVALVSEGIQPSRAQLVAGLALFGVVAFLSIGPVRNMASSSQVMNTSFDRLYLVNTYGAFGSVGDTRPELVFSGTQDEELGSETEWKEYDFKCKPDRLDEAPCVITPYHRRLDWLLWFAAMRSPDRYPWVVPLVFQFLENNPHALALIGDNPFPDQPPRWVRVERYQYRFTGFGEEGWWTREYMGGYLPPLRADDPRVTGFLQRAGYRPAREDSERED